MDWLNPTVRKWALGLGLAAAIGEWAAALAAREATGAPRTLLCGLGIFLALCLFVGSFLRNGGFGRSAFLGNFAANLLTYGAILLGVCLFWFGPAEGVLTAMIMTPIAALAVAVRQTWPLLGDLRWLWRK